MLTKNLQRIRSEERFIDFNELLGTKQVRRNVVDADVRSNLSLGIRNKRTLNGRSLNNYNCMCLRLDVGHRWECLIPKCAGGGTATLTS